MVFHNKLLAGIALGVSVAAASLPVYAHHSFAMFSDESQNVTGTVVEFRFTNPHTFILLAVTGEGGETTVWNLEGSSPSGLSRAGWHTGLLQPGDEITVEINPLRSGAPGGSWDTGSVTYADGTPVVQR